MTDLQGEDVGMSELLQKLLSAEDNGLDDALWIEARDTIVAYKEIYRGRIEDDADIGVTVVIIIASRKRAKEDQRCRTQISLSVPHKALQGCEVLISLQSAFPQRPRYPAHGAPPPGL
jgi:hypothetical protein